MKRKFIEKYIDTWLERAESLEDYLTVAKAVDNRYRYLASFKITPHNIMCVRGYELIETVGWYCKTFNMSGLMKDHRFSIKDGYDRNIDPEIIGHLANCELLPAAVNLKKSGSSSISLRQLNKEIRNW